MRLALLLLLLALSGPALGTPDQQLTITPLGHAAVRVADDHAALFVDFPYDPGSDFTPWNAKTIPQGPKGLCVITHAHRDHFAPELADRYCAAVVAPKSTAIPAQLSSFGVEEGSVVEWKGIAVHALASPHDTIEHYSYLIVWRGVRLFFSGDAETPEAVLKVGNVDVAFLTPRLLMVLSKSGTTIEADRIFSYHHRPNDPVPDVLGRIISQPGQSETIAFKER